MTPVLPADLPAHWEFVLRGLEIVIAKTGEKWTPTHVRQGINEGWAHLFVCEDGFAVIQRLKEDWTADLYIHVWAMWFKPDKARAKRKELVSWLNEVRDKAGCRRWKFGSPRMGWSALDNNECEVERVIWRSR